MLRTRMSGVPGILGHSFGGKVAALYGHRFGENLQACAAYSAPSRLQHPDAHGLVPRVIQTPVRAGPFTDRSQARHASSPRVAEYIVAWLLTGLKRGDEDWRWCFNLAMAPLLASYRALDLWGSRSMAEHFPFRTPCCARVERALDSVPPEHCEPSRRRACAPSLRNAGHWIQ